MAEHGTDRSSQIIILLLFIVSCSGESDEMENGRTCMGLERYDKAVMNLNKETDNNPGNAEAYCLKGESLIFLKKITKDDKPKYASVFPPPVGNQIKSMISLSSLNGSEKLLIFKIIKII